MKKISILALAAVTLSAACTPKYNPNDARTFGLNGDVKEVYLSEAFPADPAEGVTEDEWFETDTLQMSFDSRGRVTRDPFGNLYEYDGEGNFLGGQLPQTELLRDTKGRIVSYDNTSCDDYSNEDFDISLVSVVRFTYDAKGRPLTAGLGGWEWENSYTFSYEGNKVYPASASFEGGSEGWNEAGTVSYTYTGFDARGNWTERTYVRETRGWEEPWEENMEPQVDTSRVVMKQARVIKYWSDKK